MKQYDAIIIGFGKGGKLLAAELANRNWKVAIIERSPQMYGGTCVNVGCIPHQSADLRIGTGRTALPGRLQQSGQILCTRHKAEKQARIILAGQESRAYQGAPQYYVV